MKTLKEVQKEFLTHAMLVEITDREEALNQITSKTSSCWGAGQKIGDTGWIHLASPSKQSKGDIQTIFVCKETLIA